METISINQSSIWEKERFHWLLWIVEKIWFVRFIGFLELVKLPIFVCIRPITLGNEETVIEAGLLDSGIFPTSPTERSEFPRWGIILITFCTWFNSSKSAPILHQVGCQVNSPWIIFEWPDNYFRTGQNVDKIVQKLIIFVENSTPNRFPKG